MTVFFNSNTNSVQFSTEISKPRQISGLLISNFIKDGFVHVMDVCSIDYGKWSYKNIDENVLYDNHYSWVYMITVDNIIVKIGETGNLLGYRNNLYQHHPSPSTKGRFSRYIAGDGTDEYVRHKLFWAINAGHTVSFWAKKCKTVTNVETIMGESVLTESSTHKSQEVAYLDKFKKITGFYPYLNKGRK